ncbi:MAG: DUF3307 domain-containing protein [Oceanicaulis sp.]
MLETFLTLLAAHMVADFLLQFDWVIRNKRKPAVFAFHAAVVGVTALMALGVWTESWAEGFMAAVLVTAAHAAIDAVKTWGRVPQAFARPRGWDFEAFTLDQLAHLASILAVAALLPTAFADGAWAGLAPGDGRIVLAGYALLAGFLIAARAGQFFIALFMSRFALTETRDATDADQGLVNGGAWIGLLERSLVFALVLAGRFDAIGFLIAAKSVLRFSYASKDRSHSEYVIIGTLMSFSWAIASAGMTLAALHHLAG